MFGKGRAAHTSLLGDFARFGEPVESRLSSCSELASQFRGGGGEEEKEEIKEWKKAHPMTLSGNRSSKAPKLRAGLRMQEESFRHTCFQINRTGLVCFD